MKYTKVGINNILKSNSSMSQLLFFWS